MATVVSPGAAVSPVRRAGQQSLRGSGKLRSDTPARPDTTARPDTLPAIAHVADTLRADSIVDAGRRDSVAPAPDTTRRRRFVKEQVDLDNTVEFAAKDSIVLIGRNNAFMYGKGAIKYGDIALDASRIKMDMNTSVVYAIGSTDSIGDPVDEPVFKDKSGEYSSKTMRYNFRTKKGFITDVATQQGEGYLTGGITKKMENDEFYIKDGRYTTCDDRDDPHFYFQITKGKVRPKKNITTGPVYMVLAGVPLPLAVPFGYFPFSNKYSSGIIMPTFGEDYNRGFFARDGGYYFAINDNIDLALTGEIYSRGSWGITAHSNYVKRYRFSGSFDVSYITTVEGTKGDPDYSKLKNFKVAWSHTQDVKANPNLNFSASVNFTTSGYTRNDMNSYYSSAFTENAKSSTINLTYRVPNSKWTLSTNANISQRTQDSTLTVSFPNLTVTMSQTAPFKRKNAVGAARWYEKIKLSYTGYFQNSLTAKQNQFFRKSLIKDWRNGIRHTVPISATFTAFKYFNVTPNITLNDRMYTSKIKRAWDPNASAEVLDTAYSFYNIFDFNVSLSADTKIYGFYKPMKFLGDKVRMIRHVMTPSISFTYAPDFSKPGWGYWGTYEYERDGVVQQRKYSYFSHGIFGGAPSGKSGVLSWSLANNLEMKVKSDKDSTGVKKVSLIENLVLSQSYNFAADSLRLSNLNASIMLRLTKEFNLNISSTWDPYIYELNEYGNPVHVNKLRVSHHKGLFRLTSAGTSFSYTLNNDTFKKKDKKGSPKDKKEQRPQGSRVADNMRSSRQPEQQQDGAQLDGDGYQKWEFPWSLTLNYSVSYGLGAFDPEKMEYKGRFTQNLSLSGNCRPTRNWNFSFTASYDFQAHKLAYMNCTITRDLHCFTMGCSFVPVGPYKSYNFHIAVKSSLLSDLKYDKRSSRTNGTDWY